MPKHFIITAPECDICLVEFDVDIHRPKCLPCGHTICRDCVQNTALGRRCPTCRKFLTGLGNLPDNIFMIRMIEEAVGGPPRKVPRREDVQQLERGVDAGRKVVQQLRQLVPMAVEALNRQLDSSVAQLHQMEEALANLQRGTAGEEGTTTPELAVKHMELAVLLEGSARLLNTKKCDVVAEEGVASWRASVKEGPIDHVIPLLLLQLHAGGQLQKVDVVGPPRLSTLSIEDEDDLDDNGQLKVDDILRHGRRWKNIRILQNLNGHDSENLLRLMAPYLEELGISGQAGLEVLEEVGKMSSLKKLIIKCENDLADHPDLPFQLEKLTLSQPSEKQLRSVLRMPRLRSLAVDFYFGPVVSFPLSQHGGLLWLGVSFDVDHKDTMLSLIRAYATSLQELQIYTPVSQDNDLECYFPDLGRDLATCGLRVLRRLVLERSSLHVPCLVDACLLQRQTIRGFLPSSVDVFCEACDKSVF
ncbi:uncharacterized protein LOC113210024 isoform X2 [Frankliniella occidentalis]|uniref:Uncharacterized protein LOC113210024 isoform X2 n=1 Tax=Frankliniella occidentalis TaxID=133901 RepID=A0A9C6WVT2_FRAOC|nr:uncharacterized protein LOC113210024 isoform X2 [Frankliniella occidentalis]